LTRHRFIDRLRKHRTALSRERLHEGNGWENAILANDPPAEHVAQAEDLWNNILELCPPEHRDILQMKREGAVNADVAARTGLHEGSVRRILCNVAQKLAKQQEGEPGGTS
jgi:RNA polymerase sigma-70 factor (ECF subfamily)